MKYTNTCHQSHSKLIYSFIPLSILSAAIEYLMFLYNRIFCDSVFFSTLRFGESNSQILQTNHIEYLDELAVEIGALEATRFTQHLSLCSFQGENAKKRRLAVIIFSLCLLHGVSFGNGLTHSKPEHQRTPQPLCPRAIQLYVTEKWTELLLVWLQIN